MAALRLLTLLAIVFFANCENEKDLTVVDAIVEVSLYLFRSFSAQFLMTQFANVLFQQKTCDRILQMHLH